MKKIITAAFFIFTAFTVFSQTDSGFNMDEILAAIDDDEAMKDVDLSQLEGKIGAEEELAIRAELEKDNVDASTIESTMEIIEGINTGLYDNLGDVEDKNPELYKDFEDALITAMAKSIASEVIGEDSTDLKNGLKTIDSIFNILGNTAQATAYTSTTTSLFGYQGYKYFALSLGFSGSFASDIDKTLAFYNKLTPEEDIAEKLAASGVSAGVSAQAFSATIGFNMDWLIEKSSIEVVLGYVDAGIIAKTDPNTTKTDISLLLNGVKVFDESFTKNPLPGELEDIKVNNTSSVFGLKANYQLIKPLNVPILFRWNGVSVSTGIIYTGNKLNATMDLGSALDLKPGLLLANFYMDSYAITIPLEASTAIRLLSVINVSAGAGVDFQFGEAKTGFGLDQDTSTIGGKLMTKVLDNIFQENNMNFPYTHTSTVGFFNPRINAGVGVGLGPVTLDFSAFYYLAKGVSFTGSLVLRF